ncbi:MAG: hypothetical protein OXG39_09500 [Chloroflexi bacterium]|nr:hypothetical protein [Chloroflexota bacterium]
MQEENRKMLAGREIALIHNHPNNTAASQADLDGSFWLGAKSLTVVTPSGYRYVYLRGTQRMELAAVINDSICGYGYRLGYSHGLARAE